MGLWWPLEGGLFSFIAFLILPALLKRVGKVDFYFSYIVSLEAYSECGNWGLSGMSVGECLCSMINHQVPGTEPLKPLEFPEG